MSGALVQKGQYTHGASRVITGKSGLLSEPKGTRKATWCGKTGLGVALLLSTLAACGSDFEPGSYVNKVRILAVVADKPYAKAGETVSLETLGLDPLNRPLSWAVSTCSNPSAATVMGCLEAEDGESYQEFTGGAPKFTIKVPSSVRVGSGALLGVVIVACPGKIVRTAPAQGRIPFQCFDSVGRSLSTFEFEVGMKRILLRADDRNANPAIGAVMLNGKPWPSDFVPSMATCKSTKPKDCSESMTIGVTTSGAESGVDEIGTRFEEQVVVHYYTSAGSFEDEVRSALHSDNVWAARELSGVTSLYFVVRDDRGGVAWTSRKVLVVVR